MNLDAVFWESIDIGAIYAQHGWAIDGLIYLILFVGLTTATIGRHFNGRGGRAIAIASGVALTVAAVTASRASEFALVELGGFAWALLLLVLGILVYDLMRRVAAPRAIALGVSLLFLSLVGSTIGSPIKPLLEFLGLAAGLLVLGILGLMLIALAALLHKGPHSQEPSNGRWATSATHGQREANSRVESPDPTEPQKHRLDDIGVISLLEQLDVALSRGPPDARTEHLLMRISQGQRAVDSRFEDVLRFLARSGWRSDPAKKRLAQDVKALLKAARRNSTLFREALRIAEAGHDAGNITLIREAIRRLVLLERESEAIESELRVLLARLRGVSPPVG